MVIGLNSQKNSVRNHRAKYTNHGIWALPVFPNNISLIGSVPTPYIYDDRVSPDHIAAAIDNLYSIKIKDPDLYNKMGEEAYKWVTSDESMMSSRLMAKNVIETVYKTFKRFEPRHRWELIEIEDLKPKHYTKYPIPQ
jgi:hypothetical protein